MAIPKNDRRGKTANPNLTALLEEERPTSKPDPAAKAKSTSERQTPGSAKKQAITHSEYHLEEPIRVSPELRERMVRDAAYFRAESRGFAGGDPAQDWLEAEAEIEHLLGGSRSALPN
jgi:hypothetical protein